MSQSYFREYYTIKMNQVDMYERKSLRFGYKRHGYVKHMLSSVLKLHTHIHICFHTHTHIYIHIYIYILFQSLFPYSESESCSVMSSSLQPHVAHQAPPSMEFSRQEYQRGLPFPSPGDFHHPGIEPRSPTLQADSLASEPLGKPFSLIGCYKILTIVPCAIQ